MMRVRDQFSIFCSRKMLCLLLLGFSSGLPLALCTTTLQAWLSVNRIDILTIGSATLIGMPYVWKFLWAPALDRIQLPFSDHRRAWMGLMQISLALTLLAMASCQPAQSLTSLLSLAVLLAVFSATQDIAINAYQTEVMTAQERGPGIAVSTGGYRIAMVVSGGLALIMADNIGWQLTYVLMAFVMLLLVSVTLYSPSVTRAESICSWRHALINPFKIFFQNQYAIVWLAFIILFKVGDAIVLGFSTPFLLTALHFSLTDVGILNKVIAISATLLGVMIGGWSLPRIGLYRALMVFGLMQAASNLGFALLGVLPIHFYLAAGVIFIEELSAGMATAALLALIMQLCQKPYTATHFALLTAVSAIARVMLGPAMGWGLHYISWSMCFVWTFLLSLPALALLQHHYLRSQLQFSQGTGSHV